MTILTIAGKNVRLDDEDVDLAFAHKWRLCDLANPYFATSIRGEESYLHKMILGVGRGIKVDHKDHNTLNNQKDNLRLATESQNQQNRRGARPDSGTGVRGVYHDKKRSRFRAYIVVNKKYQHLGHFKTLEEAALAAHQARVAQFTHYV